MESNYVQDVVDRLARRLPGQDDAVLRLYALLVLTLGVHTSLRDVHDAWAVWRSVTKPDHPDLVRFEGLSPEVQAYDQKYALAIREVAAELRQ